jgi:hypothetical protein
VKTIIGVDEAGYGPVLGPLVVSAVALEVAGDIRSEMLREVFGEAVTRSGKASAKAVMIDDSKRVYGGGRGRSGLARLERGVLGALAVGGWRPSCLAELLAAVAPRTTAEMGGVPWYADGRLVLPLATGEKEIDHAARRLADGLDAAGGKSFLMHSEIVLEPRFNARLAELESKAAVLFEAFIDVLRRAAPTAGDGAVVVDRHGGRSRYLALLQRSFPEAWVWIVGESERLSAYRIERQAVKLDVCFEVQAEQRHLAVALASMVSKYLRELFMELLNRFWTSRRPGLDPTSGYWPDGRRFLAEVTPLLEAGGLSVETLRRMR